MDNDTVKNDLRTRLEAEQLKTADLEAEIVRLKSRAAVKDMHHHEHQADVCAEREQYKLEREEYRLRLACSERNLTDLRAKHEELRGKYEGLKRKVEQKRKYESDANGDLWGGEKTPVQESRSASANKSPGHGSKLGPPIARKASVTLGNERNPSQTSPVVVAPSFPAMSPSEPTNDPRKAAPQSRSHFLPGITSLVHGTGQQFEFSIVHPGRGFFDIQYSTLFLAPDAIFALFELELARTRRHDPIPAALDDDESTSAQTYIFLAAAADNSKSQSQPQP
ncbi:hypothetical protein K438DRAFT_1954023 [Mycena galopus ATCC 62051]|nr:hypothetical protein K438DRAFT_1954023 [Mycena galopus ATCC 62051]